MEPEAVYVARITECVCGHIGIDHYDSHLICHVNGCKCEAFEAAEPEEYVEVGRAKSTPLEPPMWEHVCSSTRDDKGVPQMVVCMTGHCPACGKRRPS